MSLLWKVIFAGHARSTHHKLALDAMKLLQHPDAQRWMNVILNHHAAFLTGAKAPDDDFKDFRNHVLHVRENFWGGAVTAAHNWFGTLTDHLRGREWKDAAYAAGVLSHYVTDPLMPFHTGQTESEGAVHRALEWSVTQSYDTLRDLIGSTVGGYPRVTVPVVGDWLSTLIRDGAVFANQFYELLIDHYDLSRGVKNPKAGLDQTAQEAVARCLAQATVRFAIAFDRALEEAEVMPPDVTLSVPSVLATLNVPIRKLTGKLADASDRREVEAIWHEVQETGKAIESLPESERLVRQFHAKEVLRVPLAVLDKEKARPAGTQYVSENAPQAEPKTPVLVPAATEIVETVSRHSRAGGSPATAQPTSLDSRLRGNDALVVEPVKPPQASVTSIIPAPAAKSPAPPKFYLRRDAPIVDAPSIGPKMAARFEAIGLRTVADLIACDPQSTAAKLNMNKLGGNVLNDWQAQSLLMLSVSELRGHDAQLLVASGIRDIAALRSEEPAILLPRLTQIASSSEGRRILRDSAAPDLQDVTSWISSVRERPAALKAG